MTPWADINQTVNELNFNLERLLRERRHQLSDAFAQGQQLVAIDNFTSDKPLNESFVTEPERSDHQHATIVRP
jgi:hypothetical protein